MVFLVSGVEMLFGLVPFKTCPFFGLLFVVLFFFLWLLGGSSTTFFFFSVSLSFRCWGTTNPCGVCVSPSVSSSWTRTPTSTRTSSFSPSPRPRPAPVFFLFFFFFFFVRRSVAGSVFFSFLVLVLVGFSGGGFGSVCLFCISMHALGQEQRR